MRIVTWQSADAPASQRWLARFQDGKRFLPALLSGPDEDAVREKAQTFWDAEKARYAKREGRKPETVADAFVERVGAADPVVEGAAHLTSAERAYGEDEAADMLIGDSVDVRPRYFYHPESDCLMTSEDGSHPGTDGLVEEIDRAAYEQIENRQAGLTEDGLVPSDKGAIRAVDEDEEELDLLA